MLIDIMPSLWRCVKGCDRGASQTYDRGMRWEKLFDDYEAQLAAQRQRDLEVEGTEEARHQRGLISMAEHLLGHHGHRVRFGVWTGSTLEGEVVDVGMGWLMLADGAERILLVMGRVVWWEPLVARSVVIDEVRARTMPLTAALRALISARTPVRVALCFGPTGIGLRGLLLAVGRDHLELALLPEGCERLPLSESVQRRIIPVDALCAVTSEHVAADPSA